MIDPGPAQATLPLFEDGSGGTAAPGSESRLTAEQQRAVAARDRDVLLQAGAGTGKTRVLVERYCDAITEDGLASDVILAFTFTERSAAELRNRIRAELTERASSLREAGDAEGAATLFDTARASESAWVTTIHGFCRRLLASHPAAAGLDPRFRVLDESEATRLREACWRDAITAVVERDPDGHGHAVAAYGAWRVGQITIGAYERLRSQGMIEPRLPEVSEPVRSRKRDEPEPEPLSDAELEAARTARRTLEAVLEAYGSRYEEAKAARSGLDFADLELRAVALLRESEHVGAGWRGRFAHIMVDEFQDTSRVQLELVELLRGPETCVFEVGDEFQSIYRFRNADLEVFRAERRAVEEDPTRELLPLTGNFRSLPPVLGAVNALGDSLFQSFVPLSAGRRGETVPGVDLLLTPSRRAAEDPESWWAHAAALEMPPSERSPAIVAEARFLAQHLRRLVDAGEARRGDIVVLLRAFTHVDAFEEALARAGLDPYVLGGRGYWSSQQVEDILRILGTVSNPLDDEALFGTLSSPACGVSPDALWLLRRATDAKSHVWPLVEWRYGGNEREPDRLAEGWEDWLDAIETLDADRIERFCETLNHLRAEAPLRPLDSLVERAMDAFGYDLALLARPGGAGRMANARKLMRLARSFEQNEGRNLAGFLAAAEESTRRDEREGMAPVQAEGYDGVRIMTVHAAKGLEFPVVAMAEMGRALNAGHRWEDLFIGRPEPGVEPRFGMRLAFPATEPIGLWELHELGDEESLEASEEGARLVHVAATRAEDRLIVSGAYRDAHLEPCEEHGATDTPLRRFLPVLCKAGWDGGDGRVELPPPPAAAGTAPLSRPTMLTIDINRASAEQAATLSRPRHHLVAAPELPTSRPPLRDHGHTPVPLGHLSYSALAGYERCGYRFYAERVLRLAAPATRPASEDGDAPPEDPSDDAPSELVEPPPDPADADGVAGAPGSGLERGLALGNAVHAALERSALTGWSRPQDTDLAALLEAEGLEEDVEAGARARALIDAWLDSELRERLDGMRLRPEVPFVVGIAGTVVRGKIDLLASGEDREPVVVDFKTDALRGRDPDAVAMRYAAQQEVYALAAGTSLGDEVQAVKTVHCFLEAAERPVERSFGPTELNTARARLETVIARMRAGEFVPTATPDGATCFGCPAAARLCPHPAWRPPAGG